jgi:hypothetical protein
MVLRPIKDPRIGTGQSAGAAGWIVASVLYSLRFHGLARVVIVALGIAIALGAFGLLSLSRRRTKLALADRQLTFSGLLGDRVSIVNASTWRVAELEVFWGNISGRRSRLWCLVNAAGRAEVSLNRAAWDAGQLESLRESLGVPLEVAAAPKRPAEVRQTYPGTIPWWAAHPATATLLVVVVITVLVLALQLLAT